MSAHVQRDHRHSDDSAAHPALQMRRTGKSNRLGYCERLQCAPGMFSGGRRLGRHRSTPQRSPAEDLGISLACGEACEPSCLDQLKLALRPGMNDTPWSNRPRGIREGVRDARRMSCPKCDPPAYGRGFRSFVSWAIALAMVVMTVRQFDETSAILCRRNTMQLAQ